MASTSVVLPDPLGPTSAMRSAHAMSTLRGPRVKSPRCRHASASRTTTAPDRVASLMVKRRSQPSHGFSTTSSDSSARSVRRALRGQLLRPVDAEVALRLVVVAGVLLLAGDARRGPLPFALGPPAQLGALVLVGRIGLGRVGPFRLALGLVARPAAAVRAPRAGALVQLEHVGHRAVEEGPVVGDDDHGAPAAGDHVLQAGQAVEVEVVGRLVEQGDVEAGEEDGGQGEAGRLAPGERRRGLPGEARRESHLLECGGEACLEVAGGDRLVPGERRGVPVVGARRTGPESGRGVRQVGFRGGDTGAAVQRGADALAGGGGVLLAQVAHGRRRRVDAHVALERHEQARQDLQQRRLADPVGADHAQAGGRAGGQRHVVEDGAATAFVVEVAGDECRGWCGQERHG